ncbi:hypothetical protein ACFO1B_10000 [Dactylosporangium siamense]|uniref:Uncharacterized protein n=1 Tax=Dactylosporangium siamense TaxID=685454 RepID=A0A919PTI2_9ACTN|nr:hypothetical protein [Dactylosporangium siamense]GIG49026.1 hypothetical protein Dsi01nite_070670 [Dactylosporangium siamense]
MDALTLVAHAETDRNAPDRSGGRGGDRRGRPVVAHPRDSSGGKGVVLCMKDKRQDAGVNR